MTEYVSPSRLKDSFTTCVEAPVVQPASRTAGLGLNNLQLAAQQHISFVLQKLFASHYGISTDPRDADAMMGTTSPEDSMLITLVIPTIGRRDGEPLRQQLVDKINSFVDDLSAVGKDLRLYAGTVVEQDMFAMKYHPRDMHTALSCLVQSFMAEDRELQKELNYIGHINDRIGEDHYTPAHRLN